MHPLDPARVTQTRLHLLNGLQLAGPDGVPINSILAQPKRAALLIYLALAAGGPFHRRDALLPIFWPELDQERARAALRKSLHFLRQSLGDGVVLARGDEEIGLNLWCDAFAFRSAIEDGQHGQALALYKSDLLPGFFLGDAPQFEQWLDDARKRLRSQAAQAAALLSEQCEAGGALTDALRHARQAITLDPTSEPLLRRLVSMLIRTGDRAGASHAWEAWRQRLDSEFGLKPGPETRDWVRAALAESAAQPAIALSIPESAILLPPPPVARNEDAQVRPARSRSNKRVLVAGAFAMVLALVLATAMLLNSEPANPRRVVLAAFVNETGDPAYDAMSRRISDWLIAGLIQVGAQELVPIEAANSRAPDGIKVGGSIYLNSGGRLQIQTNITDSHSRDVHIVLPPLSTLPDSFALHGEELRQRIMGAVAALLDRKWYADGAAEMVNRPPTFRAYQEFAVGRDLMAAGSYEEAATHLGRAAQMDTAFLWAVLVAGAARVNAGLPPEKNDSLRRARMAGRELNRFEQLIKDLNVAYAQGRHADALVLAQRLDKEAPGPLPAFMKANIAIRLNLPAMAVNSLERPESARGMMESSVTRWNQLTMAQHMLGDHARELRVAREARQAYPDHLRVLDFEVRALAAQGKEKAVARRLDLAAGLKPTRNWPPSDVMYNAGLEFHAHGYNDAAQAAFKRAIAWHLSRPADEQQKRQRDLAEFYMAVGRNAEAEAIFRALAAQNPVSLPDRAALAVLATRRGDRTEAERITHDMMQLNMVSSTRQYWLAVIAAQLEQRDEAVDLLRDAFARGRSFSIDLHRDLLLAPLRKYEPFQQLVQPRD